jgi:hypothetical protein
VRPVPRQAVFTPAASGSATLPARIAAEAAAWAAGRNWIVRAPIVLWLAWIGLRQCGSAEYASLFGAINLGIHEAGHFVFSGAGDVLRAAGGTILQCLAPIAAGAVLLRQSDWFGVTVCLGWLSTNVHHVGTYMADAEDMRLPLVTVGSPESVRHDWRFLFEEFDVLHRCEAIGATTHGLAHLMMAAAVASGAWLLWKMARTR